MSSGVELAHIRALDGVRGVAVMAVLLFHADLLTGGYLGVDLFFVLSGFLITSLLLAEAAGTGRIGLLAFWARRARRLLPALFLVIAAVVVYAAVFAESSELYQIRNHAFATLGYVANWRFLFDDVDYWSQFLKPSPLEHTWSLAIEEQFYIVWPLVVFGVLAWGRNRGHQASVFARRVCVLSGVFAIALSAWALWIWVADRDAMRIYFGTDTRAPAILFGATFAAWTAWRGPPRNRRMLEISGILGALFLGVAWIKLDGENLFRGGLLACSVAALVVVAAAVHPQPGVIARALSFRPFVALGLISYGVYLWHWPIYQVIDAERTDLSGWPLFALRFVVTLVISIASYHFVEQPIRRGVGSPRGWRLATPVLVAALVGSMIIVTAGADDGGPAKQVLPDPALLASRAVRNGATRVMVAGNSVANALADEGFQPVKTDIPIVVLNDGVFSCDFPTAPFIRTEVETEPIKPVKCTGPWQSAIDEFDPDLVILVFGDIHVTDYWFPSGWASQCDALFAPAYRDALDRAVAKLGARGARVVLTTSAYSRLFLSRAANDRVADATDCTNGLVREYAAEHPNVELVDVNRFMCPTRDTCRTHVDGAEIRPDGVHYRAHGAQVVAAWVLDQLGIEAEPSS